MKKLLIPTLLILLVAQYLFINHSKTQITPPPSKISTTPTTTPTPPALPIKYDQTTNLNQQLSQTTPDSFDEDFKQLTSQVNNF